MTGSTDLSRKQLDTIHFLMLNTDANVGSVSKMVTYPGTAGDVLVRFHALGYGIVAYRIARNGTAVAANEKAASVEATA